MKISEIVKVNLTTDSTNPPISSDLNLTAGAIIIIDGPGVTDLTWKTGAELLDIGVTFTNKAAFERLVTTYSNNGGVNIVAKRIYDENLSAASVAAEVVAAINGSASHTAVAMEVINIMLVDESGLVSGSLLTIAQGIKNTAHPEEEKLLLLNRSAIPAGLAFTDNIFLNNYQTKAEGGSPAQNNYEVALAAAYVSKLNYGSDIIKGFEYTPFQGYNATLENLNIANALPNPEASSGTHSNIIAYLVGRYLAIGGLMTDGTNFLTKYFSIVLTQKVTNTLTQLVVNKLKFQNTTYSAISNTLTEMLDVFTKNSLLDTEYVAAADHVITIDNVAYPTIAEGDIFTEGYRVFTLPPSQTDLTNKLYSGVYVYLAIGNQIRTINVSGLVLGGV